MLVKDRDLLVCLSISLIFSLTGCRIDDCIEETNLKPKEGFLWEVRSKTVPVYLLGVIHVANEDIYPLPNAFQLAFDRACKLKEGVEQQRKILH